jgi:hypothetical protein
MSGPEIYGRVRVDEVLVGARHRKLDKGKVVVIAESINAIGLQTPISVYRDSEGHIHLVAGYHRLEAAKLLGWEEIDCIFVMLSESDRDLWEKRPRDNGTQSPIKRGRGRPKGFATETAAVTGKSKRTINRYRAEPKPRPKRRRSGPEIARDNFLDGFIPQFEAIVMAAEAVSDFTLVPLTPKQRVHTGDIMEKGIAVLMALLDRLKDRDAA